MVQKIYVSSDLVVESFPIGSLGCNCSLIYSPHTREAIAIDPGNDAETFLQKIQERQLHLQALLHTHAHFDHIGGSSTLKAKLSVPLYLHRGDQFLYDLLPQQGMFFGVRLPPPAPIDHYLQDEQTFEFSHISSPTLKEMLQTIYTPGHTPGSCSFFLKGIPTPILFSGDTLFQNSIGRTDLPGGDGQLIVKSIKERIYRLPGETLCVPGHGEFTTLEKEKRGNPFVRG